MATTMDDAAVVDKYSRIKQCISKQRLKRRRSWKSAGFRNGAVAVRNSKFVPPPGAAALAGDAAAAAAVLLRQGLAHVDPVAAMHGHGLPSTTLSSRLGASVDVAGGAVGGGSGPCGPVGGGPAGMWRSMQSVRVFARPSFLLPASGAAAYPGEGEGVYEDEKGRKYPGTYLPWFKRKGLVQVKAGKSGKMKEVVLRGGRSPFHGHKWRQQRRRAPTAVERSKRIGMLATKLFFECDRNGDGVVTRSELRNAVINRSLTMRFLGLEHTHVGHFFDVDHIFEVRW